MRLTHCSLFGGIYGPCLALEAFWPAQHSPELMRDLAPSINSCAVPTTSDIFFQVIQFLPHGYKIYFACRGRIEVQDIGTLRNLNMAMCTSINNEGKWTTGTSCVALNTIRSKFHCAQKRFFICQQAGLALSNWCHGDKKEGVPRARLESLAKNTRKTRSPRTALVAIFPKNLWASRSRKL